MTKQTKYAGIATGSHCERGIDIVAEMGPISGPTLAARLGFSVYEMTNLRRAVQLGYIKKAKSPDKGNMNIYTVGENFPAETSGKSGTHILLAHIAERGKLTSLELAALVDMEPGAVSGCLCNYTKNGVVKVRLVSSEGKSLRKYINEYYDADLVRYRENHARGGLRQRLEASPDEPQEKPNLVPPRTPPEFRPLNLAKLGAVPQRDGAWDFRNIPSGYARSTC
jgi:hypothetical protein